MSFESFAVTLDTSDSLVFQMPSYSKTRDGEYAILPKSGAVRVSVYNANGSSQTATVKVKTIFDLEPVTIGELEIPAGDTLQWPVPISLGPGDFVTAVGSVADDLVVSGSAAASPVSPQTANGEVIWTPFTMRRPIDSTIAWAIASRTYGAAGAGGYFAGVIDTVTGTIQADDAYQTGENYALLVSPKSLEDGPGLKWCAKATDVVISDALTRWNGLAATEAIIALNDTDYEVHDYIEGLASAVATEQGSDWYLPALDELELFYRNLKPNAEDNRTDNQSNAGSFPSSLSTHGTNPSSDPTGSGYSNSPRNPDETPLVLFKEGGSQTLSQDRYWSTTDADGGATQGRAWRQDFTRSGGEGYQSANNKVNTLNSVRPARRIVF